MDQGSVGGPLSSPSSVSWREIERRDLGAITDLLCEGFRNRRRRYWSEGFERLDKYSPPNGYPRYGYVLDTGARPVGVLLLIHSEARHDDAIEIRCNLSSWYIQPQFRAYGSLLVARAIRRRRVAYLNVSPATATWPVIEAQGFRRFTDGIFAAVPALAPGGAGARTFRVTDESPVSVKIPWTQLSLLADHHRFGCVSLWCEMDGRGQPFIFRRRFVGPARIPCAQLIYCPSLEQLAAYCRPIGRALVLRGMPIMLVPSIGPLKGVPGRFFPGRMPMYYKAVDEPPLGDLTYTEAAIFGF